MSATLAFAARGEVLAMLAACALLRGVSAYLGSSIDVQWLPSLSVAGGTSGVFALVLGLVLDGVALMLLLKLAVEALLDAATGRGHVDGPGGHAASDGHALGQIFLLLILLAPVYLLALVAGGRLGLLALLGVGLALPAAIMLQAIDEHLWRSLNPLAWWQLVSRLGPGYFGPVAVLGAGALLLVGLQGALFSRWPTVLAALASGLAGGYVLVTVYHLMGRTIHAQRRALGFEVAPPIARPRLANVEEDDVMRQADNLLAEEKPGQAADCLQALIERRGASEPIHARYRQLCLAANDIEKLSAHDRQYVASLLATGQPKRALALFGEARQRDPAFALVEPEHISTLLALALASGHSETVLALGRDFATRFPRDRDVPRNLLSTARLLSERFGRDAEAIELLQGLDERFPDHALAGEIAQVLAAARHGLALCAGTRAAPAP